jgi:post-segregation antitoxin (ccd killing protein)
MKTTVYLPDDLAEEAKQLEDLNLSGLLQEALRRELQRRKAMAELTKGMTRQEVYDSDREIDVAFTGREVYRDPRDDTAAYVTKRERIAIYDPRKERLHQYDDFQELLADGWDDDDNAELMAALAQALGEDYTIELDI